MNALIYIFSLTFFTCQSADTTKTNDSPFDTHSLELSSGESGLTLADFNKDGHLDLVTANESHGNLSIFLGDGSGQLREIGKVEAGENPGVVSVADINQDDLADLVVANHETQYLTFFVGDGKGGFTPADNSPFAISVGPHPHVVKTADIDRDGIIDILVDHRQGEGILVLRGKGAGEFDSSGVVIDSGGDPYRGFALADFNGDSRLDIVTPNSGSIGLVFGGKSGLEFGEANEIPSLTPFAIDVGDFNGDDQPDFVVASEGAQPAIQVYLQGNNNFSKSNKTSFDIARGAKQIAVGDINGDGFSDALVTSWSSGIILIYGSPNDPRSISLSGPTNPWGSAVGDLNEDGKDDFIIADGGGETATVYLTR